MSDYDTDIYADKKQGCCGKLCSCLCGCIRSIPFGSIIAVVMALVGFSLTIKGWGTTASALNAVGLKLGAVEGYVGYALAATLALDVIILVFAFCATGKTREKCMGGGDGGAKKCGRCMLRFLNAIFAVLCYLAVAWNLVLVLLFMTLLVVEFIFNEMCGEVASLAKDFALNFSFFGFNFNLNGVSELTHFCNEVHPLTKEMALMFAGALISVFAQINMLINICVNFVRVGYEGREDPVQKRSKLSMALVADEYP